MPKSQTKTAVKKAPSPDKKSSSVMSPLTPSLPNPLTDLLPDKISTPEELFINDLRDMYWSEIHLVKAIPKMIASASGSELKSALEEHLEVTRGHVSRLEEVFGLLTSPNLAKKCPSLEGLIIGGEQLIEITKAGSPARETGIISSGLKVENFEITCYTGLIQLARQLGLSEAADLLTLNLEEEQEASATLMSLAKQ